MRKVLNHLADKKPYKNKIIIIISQETFKNIWRFHFFVLYLYQETKTTKL